MAEREYGGSDRWLLKQDVMGKLKKYTGPFEREEETMDKLVTRQQRQQIKLAAQKVREERQAKKEKQHRTAVKAAKTRAKRRREKRHGMGKVRSGTTVAKRHIRPAFESHQATHGDRRIQKELRRPLKRKTKGYEKAQAKALFELGVESAERELKALNLTSEQVAKVQDLWAKRKKERHATKIRVKPAKHRSRKAVRGH